MIQSLSATLKVIVNSVKDVIGCDAVTVYAYDDINDKFVDHASVGLDKETLAWKQGMPAKESVVHNIVKINEPRVSEDVKTDPLMNGRFVEREGIVSAVGLVLKAKRSKKVGVLFVSYRTFHHFVEDELANIKLFAYQAADAIHNARLYDELSQMRSRERATAALALAGIMESDWKHRAGMQLAKITQGIDWFRMLGAQKIEDDFYDHSKEHPILPQQHGRRRSFTETT